MNSSIGCRSATRIGRIDYHARLAPLMRRIRRTDWLIDQVVYQVYGLTEEEIGVVEGRPGGG